MDGLGVIRALQAWSAVSAVVLSARHEEQTETDALDADANDYLAKPFGIAELLARIEKALSDHSRTTP